MSGRLARIVDRARVLEQRLPLADSCLTADQRCRNLLKRVAAKWARTDSAANQFGALRAHKPIAASAVVAPPCAAARGFLAEDSDYELL